ncbi:nuclear transport factor 2 family protein [uncultured Nocardioides sp.]|uniref:nuclear transport factor 2 family protein n=1 Tax=uncultured Nocardioides sp. TaxID=198441 RepID=UPI002614116F|nr:nuclear transport factor 2 family protein [uncultured Nocardioides sp.]
MSSDTRTTAERFLRAVEHDVPACRGLMSVDAVWELNGTVQTTGPEEFVTRQQEDLATGATRTTVETLVVEGDLAAWVGWVDFSPHEGAAFRMRVSEWLTVDDGRVSRVRSVMVPAG